MNSIIIVNTEMNSDRKFSNKIQIRLFRLSQQPDDLLPIRQGIKVHRDLV